MIAADEPTAKGKAVYGGSAGAPLFARIGRELASYLALPPNVRTNDATAFALPAGANTHLAARP